MRPAQAIDISDRSFCPITRTHLLEDNGVEQSHSKATVIRLLCRTAQTLSTQDVKNPTLHHRASLPYKENYLLRVCSPCLNSLAMQQSKQPAAYTVDVGNRPCKHRRWRPPCLSNSLIRTHCHRCTQNTVLMDGLRSVWAITGGSVGCCSVPCLRSRGNCDSGMC